MILLKLRAQLYEYRTTVRVPYAERTMRLLRVSRSFWRRRRAGARDAIDSLHWVVRTVWSYFDDREGPVRSRTTAASSGAVVSFDLIAARISARVTRTRRIARGSNSPLQ